MMKLSQIHWTLLIGLTLLTTRVASAQDDVADVPSLRVQLPSKAVYFLIGDTTAKPDAAARTLVLVLPGGDGGESFNPFIRRIYQNALSDKFIVAELVADPAAVKRGTVWPKGTAHGTEAMIAEVAADVGKRTAIDPKRTCVLGWSSSGPALYSTAATKGSAIGRFFIAMSVFHPGDMTQPHEVKDKRFYLLHSPDDHTCPFRFAEQAEAKLGTLGAQVKLARYDGGHGWHGDVFGNIHDGIDWLLSTDDKPKASK